MVGHARDLFEDPLEVGIRISSMAADVLYHSVEDGAAPTCFFSADKEPVFSSELERSHSVLNFIVI